MDTDHTWSPAKSSFSDPESGSRFDYDIITIGTGAGGRTLAHKLAPSGKRILLLERGGYLRREPENWSSREVFRKERYLSGEYWFDRDGNPYKPHQQYYVGGNTKFYGAILFRLRERDFEEVEHYGGISPAGLLERVGVSGADRAAGNEHPVEVTA